MKFLPFCLTRLKINIHMTSQPKPSFLLTIGAKLLTFFLASILFTFLFYNRDLGINFFLADILILAWLLVSNQIQFKGKLNLVAVAAFVLTSIFSIVTHSVFVYIMHFVSIFILAGVLIYPLSGSLVTSIGLGVGNIFGSVKAFFEALTSGNETRQKAGRIIKMAGIFIIPFGIIIVFISMYSASNPWFNKIVTSVNDFLGKYIELFFDSINMALLGTFLLVSFFVGLIVFRKGIDRLMEHDSLATDALLRRKHQSFWFTKWNSLKNEYRAGFFLLLVLNAILFVVNALDINWVWFNFKWEGQYLKQFVHEGTYLLILSILISIALVLYFFRANLNFYSKNRWLKMLSYIWLGQNAILAISVGIRNFYYIQYFSLAYKRIGVVFFLLLTLYGLYTVFVKVKNSKSSYFLFRKNVLAAYSLLVLLSLFNWDVIIARYNFAHYQKSFLDLEFMSNLSDKALPWLDEPVSAISEIDSVQNQKFEFKKRYEYMTPGQYTETIGRRKTKFLSTWQAKDFLEWNYAEYRAFKKLK